MSKRKRGITGISVYQRGKTWSHRIDLEPDALTAKRQRENRGGFANEDEAWTEAVKAKSALDRPTRQGVTPDRPSVRRRMARVHRALGEANDLHQLRRLP